MQRRQTPSLPTVNPETTVWYRGHGNPITTLSLAFNQSCAIWIDFHRVPWGLPNDHFTPDDSLTMSQELSSITNKPTLLFRSGHNYQFTAPSFVWASLKTVPGVKTWWFCIGIQQPLISTRLIHIFWEERVKDQENKSKRERERDREGSESSVKF